MLKSVDKRFIQEILTADKKNSLTVNIESLLSLMFQFVNVTLTCITDLLM